MVVVRDSVFDAHNGANGMQIAGNHHIESLVQVLEQQGFENTPYAFVALGHDGTAQVHASAQMKGFLDELLFSTNFEDAYRLSLLHARRQPSLSSSPERPSQGHIGNDRSLHLLEDELMQQQQPSERATSRRLLRTARQRGRSTLPRDASITSFPYIPPVAAPTEEMAVSDNEDYKPVVKKRSPMKSFRIDSKADVTLYLESRLKRLQQLAGKKIAKAWIKGICPKKQARFPYQNSKREKETGELPRIPGWWPQEDGVCRFIEPDHIRREERMKLCLHLLRLRPSPQQLKAWNDDTTEHNKTHVMCGWTEFLKELAGPDLFDDLPKEAPNRVKLRQSLLAQMYQVAGLEEQFHNDEIDGGELYFCEEDEEDEKKPAFSMPKRSRRFSVTSSLGGEESRQSSVSASCTRAKRARTSSEHALEQANLSFEFDCEMVEDPVLGQGLPLHLGVSHDLPTPRAIAPDVPPVPLNNVPIPLDHSQSPWFSVQTLPQHQTFPQPVPAPATSSGDATLTWPEPPTGGGITSRKRALRAQRQMQANTFGDLFNAVPLKQDVQPPMPPLQEPTQQPWPAAGASHWLDTMSPPQVNPTSNSHPAHVPPQHLSGPQEYDFNQYLTTNMVQLPHAQTRPMPDTQMYQPHSLLETEMCLSLNCCPQTIAGAQQNATPMTSGEYMLPTTCPQSSSMDLQQPSASNPWQHQGLPERHIQAGHNVSDLFYSHTGGAWSNRS